MGFSRRCCPNAATGSSSSRFSGISTDSGRNDNFDRSKPFFCVRAKYLRPTQVVSRERRVPMSPHLCTKCRTQEFHTLKCSLSLTFSAVGREDVAKFPLFSSQSCSLVHRRPSSDQVSMSQSKT